MFFQEVLSLYMERKEWFFQLFLDHIQLCLIAIFVAGTGGLLLGVFIAKRPKIAPVVMLICNVFYTIPSISLLGILIPFLGIGNKTAIVALIFYALMPMVRNTYTGIIGVDWELIEAARGMGSTERQILCRVQLPLAMGIILAGLRSMTVMTIALGGIASYIGAGGLGVAIYRGITIYNPAMTFAGSFLIAILALTADFLLGQIEKKYKKRRGL